MSETYYSSVKGEVVKNALTELRPVLDKYPIETAVVTALSALEYKDRVVEDFLNVAEEFLEFGTKAQLIQMIEDNF